MKQALLGGDDVEVLDRARELTGKPETFTFLGFTHYCGKRRSNGAFTVWRKTAKKRMVAKLQAIKAKLRLRMHEPVADVGAWLRKVVTGYYRYHAIPGNIDTLVSSDNACGDCDGSFYAGAVNDARRGIESPRFPVVHSSSPRSTSPIYRSLPRHSSEVGAVCVEALVRICAGGDQR